LSYHFKTYSMVPNVWEEEGGMRNTTSLSAVRKLRHCGIKATALHFIYSLHHLSVVLDWKILKPHYIQPMTEKGSGSEITLYSNK